MLEGDSIPQSLKLTNSSSTHTLESSVMKEYSNFLPHKIFPLQKCERKRSCKEKEIKECKRGEGHMRTDLRTMHNVTHTEKHNSDRYTNLGVGDRIKVLLKSESESHSVVSDSLRPLGILQARILEWVAFPFSRGSFQPRNQTQVSLITGRFFTS